MAKGAWMAHLANFRKAHPEIDPKNMFGEAAKTYKKKQSGGSALGGELSPEAVDLDTQVATQYSGGKKSKSKKSKSKKSKSKKSKSRKSKSHKRRH